MSRSNFAARFASLIGEPPLQYLAHHRMQTAAGAASGGRAPIKEIAARVGYQTEAAFSHAFKRVYKNSPAAFRKRAKEAGGPPAAP